MRPSAPTFYVDESIYSRVLVAALEAAGADNQRVGIAVPFGAEDEVWLEVAGRNGWIALMRDKRIRYRTLEKQSLIAHGVGAFVFSGGQATAQTTAERIVALLPKMSAVATSEPRPFIYTFGVIGPLARVKLRAR